MKEIPDLPPQPGQLSGLATITGGAPRIDQISIHHMQKQKFSHLPKVRSTDFKVLQLIGAGDTGRVYLVEKLPTAFIPQAHNQTLFALKVISQNDLKRRNKMRRFEAEYDILLSSNHPFLMKMYTAFADERNFYILLEFAAGSDLATLIKRQPGCHFTESQTLQYTSEVLSALEYLHFNGIIYRDLKTENILIHQDGHCRLTDFDLSKRLLEKRDLSSLLPQQLAQHQKGKKTPIFPTPIFEQTTSFVGTAEYLSPDVLNGAHSQASDFWSFGVLIYELLYGVTPFYVQNGGFQQIKRRIQAGIFTFPRVPQTSPEAKDLIQKLLVADPTKRLGYRYGASEIKKHKWFSSVNFAIIYPPAIQMPFDAAAPLTQFREFPRGPEQTARDLAGTDFIVPPKVRLFYKQVEQAYMKAGLPVKPRPTDMFTDEQNDNINIRDNGIGTISGQSSKTENKRARLGDLFKKKDAPKEQPVIPKQVIQQAAEDNNGETELPSQTGEPATGELATSSAPQSEPVKIANDVRKSIFYVYNEDEM